MVWTIWRVAWPIQCRNRCARLAVIWRAISKLCCRRSLAKLDLVTRQDFDVQAAILERTRVNLAALETRLKEIEAKLSPQ